MSTSARVSIGGVAAVRVLVALLAVLLLVHGATATSAPLAVRTEIRGASGDVGWARAKTAGESLVVQVRLTDGLPAATFQITLTGRGIRDIATVDGLSTNRRGIGHYHLSTPLLDQPGTGAAITFHVALVDGASAVRYESDTVSVPRKP